MFVIKLAEHGLTRGSSDIIGEVLQGRDHRILGCFGVNFLRKSDCNEEPISPIGLEALPINLGSYNIALLNLFGLADIQWQATNQLAHLQLTSLGVTLLNAFQKSIDLYGLALPAGCQDILYDENGMLGVVQQWRDDIQQLLHPPIVKLYDSYIIHASGNRTPHQGKKMVMLAGFASTARRKTSPPKPSPE